MLQHVLVNCSVYTSLLVGFAASFWVTTKSSKTKTLHTELIPGRDKSLTAVYTEVHTDLLFHEPISGPIQYLLFTTLRFHDCYALAKTSLQTIHDNRHQ